MLHVRERRRGRHGGRPYARGLRAQALAPRPEEIYSTQRELIEKQIYEGIDKAITGRHVELEAVLIKNVSLPPAIQSAIQAESAAAALKINAQAAADAKRVEGKALADYQKSIQSTLTPEILKMREIDANKALADSPNTKLVLGAGAAHTLVDLRDAGGAASKGSYP